MTTFAPTDADAVREAIRWALSAGEPVEVVSGASKRAIGNPTQTAHTLDMSACAGIESYEPEELVLTLRPGTPMDEVEDALTARKQLLAFEPPNLAPLLGTEGRPTIGGTFGSNFAGPRRLSAGAVRDHMLGLSAVAGRGDAFKAGGRVVKNVTGYDLARALAGSWGTLAVATELTIKVLPAPETERTLLLAGLSPSAAVTAMATAMGSSADVSGAAHLPADVLPDGIAALGRASATVLRLEGFGPSVDARRQHLAALLPGEPATLDAAESAALWRHVRDAAAFVGTDAAVWRCSVTPSAGPALAAAAPAGSRTVFDWAGGLVWIETPATGDAGAAAIRGAIDAAGGGHATLIRAGMDLRARVPTFQPVGGAKGALAERLRVAFDPEGVLNPGRMARV